MKAPAFLLFALLTGTSAALLAYYWSATQSADGPAVPTVVIATKTIEAGLPIDLGQVQAMEWPSTAVPIGAFTSTKEVAGRIAKTPIVAGEPILNAKLAPQSATGGLSSTILEGKRAITVRVNEVVAVAGFALPGSFVDVLVSGKDSTGQSFARIVLSRIKVLAIAQETTADPAKPKVVNAVTLELSPTESEKLDLARSIGELSLALRNEFDTTEINSNGVRLPDILNPSGMNQGAPLTPAATASASKPAPAPRIVHQRVEEIRGTSRQSATSR
jgi:pilus assembly protein CpaB